METNPYTPPRTEPERGESGPSSRELVAVAMALAGSVLLAYAGWHVRADRTRRRPVITFVGPAADWVPWFAGLGYALSWLAVVVVAWARSVTSGKPGRTFLGVAGLIIAFANVMLGCFYWAGMTED